LSVARRVLRRPTTMGPPTNPVAVTSDEITYKGYRIEVASYGVSSTTWSPRAVVSVRSEDAWSRLAPLYATNTARFPTRDEADRCALDVARAWIDTAVDRRGE
jgi:hypothetical protein